MSKKLCVSLLISLVIISGLSVTGYVLAKSQQVKATGIYPPSYRIGNFYPGATVTLSVTIQNADDCDRTFEVTYKYPDNVGNGYAKPLVETESWVMVENEAPVVKAGKTSKIPVTLSMPENAYGVPDNFEFWIFVKQKGQGSVQTAYGQRWLVKMRE